MRKKHLFRFNLIEIILAMGVVAIGMTAVMALLPPALNANRDAAGDVVAAEIASKMIAYIDMQARFVDQAKANWNTAFNLKLENFKLESSHTKPKILGLDDDVLASNDLTNQFEPPFTEFVPKSKWLLNYILQENGVNYCAANVVVWYEDKDNSTLRGAAMKRFYIKVSWPGEAPNDADYRQERIFVYDLMRPVLTN